MPYQNRTIIETIKEINNVYYLPSIQRKFIWEVDQIEKLFDSLMQNYPIGTFLFWLVDKDGDPSRIDNYTFYEFLDNYNEQNDLEFMQKKLEKPSLKDKIVAVLDGQQRLSSLYCALRGSYAYKTGKKVSPGNLYPKRELYFNLLYQPEKEMDSKYQFKFITEIEADKKDQKTYWLKVKDVITWSNTEAGRNDVKKKAKVICREIKNSGYADISDDRADEIESWIEILWGRIVTEPLITFFEIKAKALDDILEIFVRVNSAGTPLSKSDLVFSTIVANWEEGREKIETLLDVLNSKGEKFKFDKDFVITLCLALMDLPQKFKVETFTKANVDKVNQSWSEITNAINDSVDLLVEFGFNKDTLTANYIIIPVAYYLFKSNKRYNNLEKADKETIRIFLISGMINRIFSASVESGLSKILEKLKTPLADKSGFELKCSERFDYDSLKDLVFQERTLKVEESNIEEILNLKQGPLTFMVLSLLYPNLKYAEVLWHQDHIHPKSAFEKRKLQFYFATKRLQIDEGVLKDWCNKCNTLVNLQILTGRANQTKSMTPLSKWIETVYPKEEDVVKYCDDNYIDKSVGFELENFDSYYAKRKDKIRARLIEIFNITIETEEESRLKEEQREEEAIVISSNTSNTIAEAAVKVLIDRSEGLTCKQIYDEIISNNLYQFNAENPEGVLRIEIRRRCDNVIMSKSYDTKLFTIAREEKGEQYYKLIL